jgi:hypothetical protein
MLKRKFEVDVQSIDTWSIKKVFSSYEGSLSLRNTLNHNACRNDYSRHVKLQPNLDGQSSNIYLPQSSTCLSQSLGELFQPPQKNMPVVLLFVGPYIENNSTMMEVDSRKLVPLYEEDSEYVNTLDQLLGSKYPGILVAVTNSVGPKYANPYTNIVQIEDENARLAREFGVLDPLGGGRNAVNALIFIDSRRHLRATVPLRSVDDSEVAKIVDESLQYLLWEQQLTL